MQSKATTVPQYLSSLPPDRRALVEAVRQVVLANMDKKGYEEGMSYGMIGYYVPHRVYPAGYHCDPKQPLPFAGLASQKNHVSFYMMGLYLGCGPGDQVTPIVRWFQDAWAKTGKKLDMGKACIRIKKIEDVPLDVIGEAIRRMPLSTYLEYYEKALNSRAGSAKTASSGKTSASKAPTAKTKAATKSPSSAKAKAPAKTMGAAKAKTTAPARTAKSRAK